MSRTPLIRLVIAGSRTVAPTIADIDTQVRLLVYGEGMAVENDDFDAWGGPRSFVLEVVCGDARGADAAGAVWARHHGIPVHHETITPADIAQHGKYVGPRMRNRRMAERGTHLIAFWDGVSAGTADMVTRMVARKKPAVVVPMKPAPRPARRQPRGAGTGISEGRE